MAFQAGVGHSDHRNPEQAGKDAVAAAMKNAGITQADFVMLFATVGYNQQALLSTVRKATNNAPLSGCSGEGVIAQNFGNESNHAVSVMVWKSDDLKFRNMRALGVSTNCAGAGEAIAREVGDVKDAKALFVLPDGLTFNFDKFVQGLSTAQLGTPLQLIGGTAGDATTQTKTYQYHNDEVFSDGVSCALLYGKGNLAVDVSHGCEVIGSQRTITKAEGNVIYEIDNKPAVEVMNEYLSNEEMASHNMAMVALCLGFKADDELAKHQGDEYFIRVIPNKDDAKKSISIYTEVKSGTKVWMTRRDPVKMMAGVDALIQRLEKTLGGTPTAVFQFECMGRGKNMFREEEKLALLDKLQSKLGGKAVPWIGFYAYGEIAPIAGKNYFHNYTSVVAALA
jgi:small ligand-binding sensory domain FIST